MPEARINSISKRNVYFSSLAVVRFRNSGSPLKVRNEASNKLRYSG